MVRAKGSVAGSKTSLLGNDDESSSGSNGDVILNPLKSRSRSIQLRDSASSKKTKTSCNYQPMGDEEKEDTCDDGDENDSGNAKPSTEAMLQEEIPNLAEETVIISDKDVTPIALAKLERRALIAQLENGKGRSKERIINVLARNGINVRMTKDLRGIDPYMDALSEETLQEKKEVFLFQDDVGRLFNVVVGGGAKQLALSWDAASNTFSGWAACAVLPFLGQIIAFTVNIVQSRTDNPSNTSLLLLTMFGLVLNTEISHCWLATSLHILRTKSVGAYVWKSQVRDDHPRYLLLLILCLASFSSMNGRTKAILTLVGALLGVMLLSANLGARAWRKLNIKPLDGDRPTSFIVAFLSAILVGISFPYIGLRSVARGSTNDGCGSSNGGRRARQIVTLASLSFAVLYTLTRLEAFRSALKLPVHNSGTTNAAVGLWWMLSTIASLAACHRIDVGRGQRDDFLLDRDETSPVGWRVPSLPQVAVDRSKRREFFRGCLAAKINVVSALAVLGIGAYLLWRGSNMIWSEEHAAWAASQRSHAAIMLPSARPSVVPSMAPSLSVSPSQTPLTYPSGHPSVSMMPSVPPSGFPLAEPSLSPTPWPSGSPSSKMSESPLETPTAIPSKGPSAVPSASSIQTYAPSMQPTAGPSLAQSSSPSFNPSLVPSRESWGGASTLPSVLPSLGPSSFPTVHPSLSPSSTLSRAPSSGPSSGPSVRPSAIPSFLPSSVPSPSPSLALSSLPSPFPSAHPSAVPRVAPSAKKSQIPSHPPSVAPSMHPTLPLTGFPSSLPSSSPSTYPSSLPSAHPSNIESSAPTAMPSVELSMAPSYGPVEVVVQGKIFDLRLRGMSSYLDVQGVTRLNNVFNDAINSFIVLPDTEIAYTTNLLSQELIPPILRLRMLRTAFVTVPSLGADSIYDPQLIPPAGIFDLAMLSIFSNPFRKADFLRRLQESSTHQFGDLNDANFLGFYTAPTNAPSTRPSPEPSALPSDSPTLVPSVSPTVLSSNAPSNFPVSVTLRGSAFDISLYRMARYLDVEGISSLNSAFNILATGALVIPDPDQTELTFSTNVISQQLETTSETLTVRIIRSAYVTVPSLGERGTYDSSLIPQQESLDLVTSMLANPRQSQAFVAILADSKPLFRDLTEATFLGFYYPPSEAPSSLPSNGPSHTPSTLPPLYPSVKPTIVPSLNPSLGRSERPSTLASDFPSIRPSPEPFQNPTSTPSANPSQSPTLTPSWMPSVHPTIDPSLHPSSFPSQTNVLSSLVWSTTQSGIESDGGWRVIRDKRNTVLIFDVENSDFCHDGTNRNKQEGSAITTIIVSETTRLSYELSGMGEQLDTGYELMRFSIDRDLVASSTSEAKGLECLAAPVSVTYYQEPPYILSPGEHTLTVDFTTSDDFDHYGAYYQLTLTAE